MRIRVRHTDPRSGSRPTRLLPNLRLLWLLRYRSGPCPAARHSTHSELRAPYAAAGRPVLATLAHFAVHLVTRLSLHLARWQSRRQVVEPSQPHADHASGWTLAWRRMELVLWGAWHSLLLVLYRPESHRPQLERHDRQHALVAIVLAVFSSTWCASAGHSSSGSLADCWALLSGLLNVSAWNLGAWLASVQQSGAAGWLLVCSLMTSFIIISQLLWPVARSSGQHLWRTPIWCRFAVVVVLLYTAVLSAPEQAPPFIYFQF